MATLTEARMKHSVPAQVLELVMYLVAAHVHTSESGPPLAVNPSLQAAQQQQQQNDQSQHGATRPDE